MTSSKTRGSKKNYVAILMKSLVRFFESLIKLEIEAELTRSGLFLTQVSLFKHVFHVKK